MTSLRPKLQVTQYSVTQWECTPSSGSDENAEVGTTATERAATKKRFLLQRCRPFFSFIFCSLCIMGFYSASLTLGFVYDPCNSSPTEEC